MPLATLIALVWNRKWVVLALSLMIGAGPAALVLLTPRAYLAEAVVAPAETTGFAASSLMPGGAGTGAGPGPAAAIGARPAGNFAVYLGTLRSAEAAAMLAAETPILASLTAQRAAGPTGALRAALGLHRPADLDQLRAWLGRRLAVTQSLGSVTWTIALSHPDRDLALDALARLHAFAEAKLRADLAETARRRVAALEARLAAEGDLYLRQSMFELLAQQQRAGLVVAADEAVAARLVSAPSVELNPSLPDRALLLGLLGLAAPMLAVGIVAALALLRGEEPPPDPPRGLPAPQPGTGFAIRRGPAIPQRGWGGEAAE